MKTNTPGFGSMAMLFSVVILIASCTGDDGAPGPAGTDGTNGSNGTDGKSGANGKNGAGFDEAIAKGNVVLILEGTRPDGLAFKDTIDYRFAPTNFEQSRVEQRHNGNENERSDIYTQVYRYQGFDGRSAEGGFVQSENEVWTYHDTDAKTHDFSLAIDNTMVVFPAEHKYFNLSTYWPGVYVRKTDNEEPDGEYTNGITSLDIISYSYDALTTGKAAYRYKITIGANYNSTGHDLVVTVIGDATVYQYTSDGSENGRRREGIHSRAGVPQGQKAEMISMQ